MVVNALIVLALYASAAVYVGATDCSTLTAGTATAAACTNQQYCSQCSRASSTELQNNCYACVMYALETGNSADPCVNVATNAQSSADAQTKAIAATDCICRAYFYKLGVTASQSCLGCSSNFQDVTLSKKCSCCVAGAGGQNGGNDCVNTGGQNTAGVTASCPISPAPSCPAATIAICPGSECVTDFKSDRNNCGKCGNACKTGFICAAGACVACPAGQTTCGTGNTCIGTTTDVNNCGGCDIVCAGTEPPAFAGTCSAGQCTCPAGQTAQPVTNSAGTIVRYQCIIPCTNSGSICGDRRGECSSTAAYARQDFYCTVDTSGNNVFIINVGPFASCSGDADCTVGNVCVPCAGGVCVPVQSTTNC